jgi:hypothetical protein
VPEGVTDDFVTSTAVIAQGYRLVFAPDAIAFEPVASTGDVEFGRKVRIMTRGLRGVVVMRELLNPRRHGFYAVQLLWHKVLRRLVAVPLVVVALSSPLLWSQGRLYQAAIVLQTGFYAAALVGSKAPRRWTGKAAKLMRLPAYFCMVNAAALLALSNILRGIRIDRWEPAREAAAP